MNPSSAALQLTVAGTATPELIQADRVINDTPFHDRVTTFERYSPSCLWSLPHPENPQRAHSFALAPLSQGTR